MHGLDTHTWKQPRENSRTSYVTHMDRICTHGNLNANLGHGATFVNIESMFSSCVGAGLRFGRSCTR